MSASAFTPLIPPSAQTAAEPRAAHLCAERLRVFGRQCDRIFAVLAVLQWAGAITVALLRSPRTWDGAVSRVHPHVYAALILGGILASVPITLLWLQPGRKGTRQVIAAAQMLWSALLIHLTDGRIETHFHVFGSLAFLAWYRDRSVLVTGTLMTVAHHLWAGSILPGSVYGEISASLWRTLEHGFWVLFEDAFLMFAIGRSLRELAEISRMQADSERAYLRVEAEVCRQTAGLKLAEQRARADEAFLERVGRIAGIGGWQLDLTTRRLTWTAHTKRIHEVDPDYEPVLDAAMAFYAAEARDIISSAVQNAIERGTSWDLELPLLTARGRAIYVRAVGEVERDNGVPCRLVGAIQEITDRVRAAQEIRKLSAAVEQTPASVVITDTSGTMEYVNPAFVEATGYATTEALGKNPRLLKSGLMPRETFEAMWRDLIAGRDWRGELQNRRKNGELYWEWAVISPLKDVAGRTTHYMAVSENITARKAMEDELRSAARTDKLTGLPNRALFADRLQQAILRLPRRKNYHFAVLFLDFDRFKSVNDSLGHDMGDLLLQQVAARLRETVRAGDSLSREAREHLAARFGGDEFVILLDDIAATADATMVADRLLQTLRRPYQLKEHEVFCTASIGIVASDSVIDPATTAETILRDADTAMYEAKLAGKSQYALFDISMRNRMQKRLDLENDLRKAVDAGQLFLMYQPIVSLQTGEVESFEALVRWQHPVRGLIAPGEFIPIAEETGLIIPIGDWVLREACAQFSRWQRDAGDAAPRSISVNLSRRQLLLSGFVATLREVLEQSGMSPSALHLEVTESAVMRDSAAAIDVLYAIKALGVRLDMDDFGTGYSSLACLHQFPIDVLKVDRSFVANIDRGRSFTALVQAVVQLARNLNIRVIAEGIETQGQAVLLQSLDCEFGQGYLFSRPLPADEVPGFSLPPGALVNQSEPLVAVPA